MDEKIYHEINGKVCCRCEEFDFFSKKLRESKLEERMSYKTDESEYGYFRVTLYWDKEERKAYRMSLWIPAFGYSWSECIVELCK